ncbi:hypothetical protein J6590_048876 [Homalodisca vitripennis]|nr:hypothetical protein J6590_096027 [Homalodisca vitripennis]KAG8296801.1 hypothetical protein J6590_048876 [Homalodisca vitripennis]
MYDANEVCTIGDTKSYHCIKPVEAAVWRKFPWRAFLLGFLRLVVSVMCLWHGSSQMEMRRDGTVTTKRTVSRRYKYLKYSHSSVVPVLKLSLVGTPELTLVSAASSLGLLVAITLNHVRMLRGYQTFVKGEADRRSFQRSLFLATVILTMLELLFTVTDMVANISETLYHTHLLLTKVGLAESVTFLTLATNLNGILLYLWFGGLRFNNELISW